MSPRYPVILIPPPLPAPELKRARDRVSRLSHQQIREIGRHSSLPVGRVELFNLDSGYEHRRTNISHEADHMGDVDAHARPRSCDQVSQSHDPWESSDSASLIVELSSPKADRERGPDQEPQPRKRIRVSSPQSSGVDCSDGHPSSHVAMEEGLSHAGSWCHLAPKESIEVYDPIDDGKDILAEDWTPMTPRDSRLSTPDLSPMCTDFEFCPCHSVTDNLEEDVKINEYYYVVSKSKMDMQLADARAHIAQARCGFGSMISQDER